MEKYTKKWMSGMAAIPKKNNNQGVQFLGFIGLILIGLILAAGLSSGVSVTKTAASDGPTWNNGSVAYATAYATSVQNQTINLY